MAEFTLRNSKQTTPTQVLPDTTFNNINSLVNAIANGLTFGGADWAAALSESLFNNDATKTLPNQLVQEQAKQQIKRQEEGKAFPISTTLGEIGGTILGPGKFLKGLSLVKQGAVIGGANEAVRSQGKGNIAGATLVGGALGVTGSVLAKGESVWRGVTDATADLVGKSRGIISPLLNAATNFPVAKQIAQIAGKNPNLVNKLIAVGAINQIGAALGIPQEVLITIQGGSFAAGGAARLLGKFEKGAIRNRRVAEGIAERVDAAVANSGGKNSNSTFDVGGIITDATRKGGELFKNNFTKTVAQAAFSTLPPYMKEAGDSFIKLIFNATLAKPAKSGTTFTLRTQ